MTHLLFLPPMWYHQVLGNHLSSLLQENLLDPMAHLRFLRSPSKMPTRPSGGPVLKLLWPDHETLTSNELLFLSLILFATTKVKPQMYLSCKRCGMRVWMYACFSQGEVDHLFSALLLPNFTYGQPDYGVVYSDLAVMQTFLDKSFKRK